MGIAEKMNRGSWAFFLALLVAVAGLAEGAGCAARNVRTKANASPDLPDELAGARPLNNRELQDVLSSTRGEKHVVVEFFVEWCPHCKKFGPVFRELEEHYSMGDDVKIVRVNATRDMFTPDQFRISGYPTLLYFAKRREFSQDSEKIHTKRDYDSMRNWIDNKVREERNGGEEFRP